MPDELYNVVCQRNSKTMDSIPRSLLEIVRFHARNIADKPAFAYLENGVDVVRTMTYGELDASARALAARLVSGGFVGKRALLMFPPGLDFISAFFGCLYAGVVAVPVFPPRRNRNMHRLDLISSDAQASVALTVSGTISRLEDLTESSQRLGGLTWIYVDQIPKELGDGWQPEIPEPQALAMLQYTSGSTGKPRGVMLSHGNILHNCQLIAHGFQTSPLEVGLSWLPTYHDMGLIGGLLQSIYMGCLTYLMSPMAFLQSPSRWLRAISRFGVTVSGGPNFAYDLCVKRIADDELEGVNLKSWKVAFNGAEPVRASTLRRFAERFGPIGFRSQSFYPCYGLAESTLMITGKSVDQAPTIGTFYRADLEAGVIQTSENGTSVTHLVSSGRVVPETDTVLKIVDPQTQRELAQGRVGEIWVSSPSVGQGYFRQPELTRQAFRARLADDDGREYLRTGDLGFLYDNELFVNGRIKDLIIINGVNHYPHDIELTVEQSSPGLRLGTAAAFAVQTESGEALIIVCEVERAAVQHWGTAIQAIRRNVAREHDVHPDGIILIRTGSIPKTSSGKIQRHACREGFLNQDLMVVAEWYAHGDPRVESIAGGGDSDSTPQKLTPGNSLGPLVMEPEAKSTNVRSPLEEVFAAVREVAGERAKYLTPQTNIVELGLDSLERLEIVNRLERRFGGIFPEDTLIHMETCAQVADAVQKHLMSPRLALAATSDIRPEQYRVELLPEYKQLMREKAALLETGVEIPYFRPFDGQGAPVNGTAPGDWVLFSSYNYLGMSGHPQVTAAAQQAIAHYGTSVSASRIVAGERPIHRQLEQALAEFLGCEDAVVFVGGHATNVTTIGYLFGPGDLILHDALAHNSIVQGAQLSGAQRRPFPHNDYEALEGTLDQLRGRFRRVLIAIEGAYSMDGDYPELPKFIELRRRYKTFLLVDEAHSLGTLGSTGRGIGELFDVERRDVDFWMGTLSKALGSCGGYIAGRRELVELLKFRAPGFVYSVGMSPPLAAAALEALRVLERSPELVRTCQARAAYFLRLARQRGFNTGPSQGTPIVPIILGNSKLALALADRLKHRGIWVHPILYPAVEESGARLRFFITSEHTEAQIKAAIDALAQEMSRLAAEDSCALWKPDVPSFGQDSAPSMTRRRAHSSRRRTGSS